MKRYRLRKITIMDLFIDTGEVKSILYISSHLQADINAKCRGNEILNHRLKYSIPYTNDSAFEVSNPS